MRKNLKVLTSMALVSAMALPLIACGGSSAPAAASSAAPAASEAPAASTAAAASEAPAASVAEATTEEGKVLNIWCWNDEFQSRFNDYYPEVQEVAADKSTTTLKDGTIVKWTINPNQDNNYQNKLDEALLAQDAAADDDRSISS